MWIAIIEVALKLVGWGIDKSKLNADQKKSFLEFYELWRKQKNSSVGQKEDVDNQLKE